jgi:hypothetical protein
VDVLLAGAIVAWVVFSVGGGIVVGRLIRRAKSARGRFPRRRYRPRRRSTPAKVRLRAWRDDAENAPAATSRIAANPRNSFVASRFPPSARPPTEV